MAKSYLNPQKHYVDHAHHQYRLRELENLLDPRKMSEDGYFDSDVVYQKWREHKAGKHNWQTELWDVLMFQAWLDI